MATPFPSEPIRAGSLMLRPWRPEEAAQYLRMRDEEVFRWTVEKREATEDQLASIIANNLKTHEWIALAITWGGEQIIGNIALRPESDGKSAEASYWLAPGGRGSGAMTAALNALTDWAFANLDIECVFLKIAPDNLSSLGVARRCRFEETPPHDERLRFERRRLL